MTVGTALSLFVAILALIITLVANVGFNGSLSFGEPTPTPTPIVSVVPSVVPSVVTPEASIAPATPSAATKKFVPVATKAPVNVAPVN